MEFETAFETGTTKPCVFQCEDADSKPAGEYVTKLRSTVRSNEIGLQYEFIAWHLAEYFEVPHLTAALVEIDQELADSIQDKVINERVKKSVGLNFGTKFVPGFNTWVAGDTIPPSLQKTAFEIVAFDAVIENPDRRIDKSNLLFKGEELLVLDHELAFAFVLTIGLDLKKWDQKRLEFLRNHPLHAGLKSRTPDLADFEIKLKKLNNKTIQGICDAVPAAFGTINEKIPAHLNAARENATEVMDVIREIFK